MPYFRNIPFQGSTIDILFIHIPKTGGTSIENYFYSKYGIQRGYYSLYGIKKEYSVSLQHMTYKQIKENIEAGRDKVFKNIDLNSPKLKIITIIRNPYHRVLSELFSKRRLVLPTTPDIVEKAVHDFLSSSSTEIKDDNHRLPQVDFFIDAIPDIQLTGDESRLIILQTENLTEQMRDLGFTDFSNKNNVSFGGGGGDGVKSYDDLLTDRARQEIREYYKIV